MMPRVRLIARVAVLAAMCAVGAPAAIASAAALPQAASGPTVRPSVKPVTVAVGGPAAVPATSTTQGFLGIATSLSTIPALAGPATDPDTPFQQLLRNLSPGAPFLLRVGGNSADDSWWPVPGMTEPPYLYTLDPQWAADVQALLKALGGKVILGVNLEQSAATDARIAGAEVDAFSQDIGTNLIDAFELGNEPEFFPLSVVTGGREHGHDTIPAYGRRFSQVAAGLGDVPLAGPGSVGPQWLTQLGTVLSDLPASLKLVTVHAYAMKNCTRLAHLSMAGFFTQASIQGLAASIHATVLAAAADGKPLRVDEINGVTCGGKAGLSNSFGEALWALNVLPALWHAGVQGVNFQTVYGDLNQMIHAAHGVTGWSVSVQPEYYGLLAFASVAPAGSRLLQVSAPSVANLYQFAVRASDGSERVVLTNVGSVPRAIAVTVPGARGPGTVSLLSAPSLSATAGVTLGGQSLSPTTGQLTGTPSMTTVKASGAGAYSVVVPAGAAAILTVHP